MGGARDVFLAKFGAPNQIPAMKEKVAIMINYFFPTLLLYFELVKE